MREHELNAEIGSRQWTSLGPASGYAEEAKQFGTESLEHILGMFKAAIAGCLQPLVSMFIE
jgi:hypothetical protein